MSNTSPLFSVCMVTYNQIGYVKQSIESVLNQIHSYDYEFLISDDCSTDGTQDIIRAYEKNYPNLIKPVYNEQNIGAMKNYFQTLNRCRGKYILFCDGDDFWEPGKVEKQISFMENNKYFDFTYSKMEIKNPHKDKVEYFGRYAANLEDVFIQNPVTSSTLCFKNEMWKEYFKTEQPDNKKWIMEDFPFVIYCFNNYHGFFLDEVLATYNVIDNSLSHQRSITKGYNFSANTRDIKKYFSEKYSVHTDIETNTQILMHCVNSLLRKYVKTTAEEGYHIYKSQNINNFKIFMLCKNRFTNVLYRFFYYTKQAIKIFVPYGIIYLLKKGK